mgnify:FL=1
MSKGKTVFALPGNEQLGSDLASALGADTGSLSIRHFPDGETYVRCDTRCDGQDVIVAANLFQPNPIVLPLIYSVHAMRGLGARRVVLASPYLPYMRQDARFQPGEVITSRIFAQLISGELDGLVTIDPHLHRYTELGELYSIPTCLGHAAPALASWVKDNIEKPLVIGPDAESEQWVSEVATLANAPYLVLNKKRRGDRDVEIAVPRLESWETHTPVLVDDIISTARTMIETVVHLGDAGYSPPVCIGVHPIFAGDAYESLTHAGAGRVVTCNTINHPSNAININEIVAESAAVLLAAGEMRDGIRENRR